MAGKLYLCATPIGNLKDITLRALEILDAVDLIVAEDTRRTRKLLTAYDIKNRLASFHDQNELKVLPRLVRELEAGQAIAQVSDAGMPGISDPGHRLVCAAIEAGIDVEVIPGASASLSAAVLSGLPTHDIRFLGYPPRKTGARRRLLESVKEGKSTIVFFESPRRLPATLAQAYEVLGDRRFFVGRELTKLYEEHIRARLGDLPAALNSELKGEIVLVIEGSAPPKIGAEEIIREVEEEIESGRSRSDAAREVADRRGLSKREVYELAHGHLE